MFGLADRGNQNQGILFAVFPRTFSWNWSVEKNKAVLEEQFSTPLKVQNWYRILRQSGSILITLFRLLDQFSIRWPTRNDLLSRASVTVLWRYSCRWCDNWQTVLSPSCYLFLKNWILETDLYHFLPAGWITSMKRLLSQFFCVFPPRFTERVLEV